MTQHTSLKSASKIAARRNVLKRFERVEPSVLGGTSKIRHRPVNRYSIGDFVSRIWALYGPPDSVVYEGFSYAFKDTETGLVFSAYAAGSRVGTMVGADRKKGSHATYPPPAWAQPPTTMLSSTAPP